MKTVLFVGLLISCSPWQIAVAQNAPAPAKPAMDMEMGMDKMPMQMKKEGTKPAMGMQMGMDKMPMPMKKNAAKPPMTMEGAPVDMDKQMPKMQANIEKMQTQMEHIKMTTDPKERARLLDEHMQTMQENMLAMRGMQGGGAGKAAPMATGAGKPEVIKKRQDTMEKRMDMMQMMLEQMMQRDAAMQPMPHM